MAIYATLDDDGRPNGFYADDIHDVIPAGAVEISDTVWRECLENQGRRALVGGVLVEVDAPILTPLSPPTLTRRQLRLGLLANGITTAQVEAVIAAIPDEIDRETAQIEWADASTYSREHPLVNQIGAAMGLTPEQIDVMWFDAAAL